MATYFLSYIEVNGHSSMMLSSQEDKDTPVKLDLEVGFGVNSNETSYLHRQEGVVSRETNASKAKYSRSAKVMHKSWEISKEEVERFKKIIDRDMVKRKPEENITGTPDYHILTMNCKFYALGVLKEVGIHEALSLENFLVQRPGSTKTQLKKLNNMDFMYPSKEVFIQNMSKQLEQISTSLTYITNHATDIKISYQRDLNKSDVLFLHAVTSAQIYLNSLKANLHKVGFDPSFQQNFCALQKYLDVISTYQSSATISTSQATQQTEFGEIMGSFQFMENPLFRMETLKEIVESMTFILANEPEISIVVPNDPTNWKENFMDDIKKIQASAEFIMEYGNYTPNNDFTLQFIQLRKYLNGLSKHYGSTGYVQMPAERKSQQDKMQSVLNALPTIQNAFSQGIEAIEKIETQYYEGRTDMYWSNPPTLSKRVDLSSFSPIERMIYFRKSQAAEIENGLGEVIGVITLKVEELSKEKAKNPMKFDNNELKDELEKLKEMLVSTKDEAKTINQEFLGSINTNNATQVREACTKQDNKLEELMTGLQSKIFNFSKSASPKTNAIIRLIHSVLLFLKIKPLNTQFTAKDYLQQRVSRVSKNLFNSKQKYTKNYESGAQVQLKTKKQEAKPVRPSKLISMLLPKEQPKSKVPPPLPNPTLLKAKLAARKVAKAFPAASQKLQGFISHPTTKQEPLLPGKSSKNQGLFKASQKIKNVISETKKSIKEKGLFKSKDKHEKFQGLEVNEGKPKQDEKLTKKS